MTESPRGIVTTTVVAFLAAMPFQLLTAQQVTFQPGFQAAFFAPASVRPANNFAPIVTDADHLPYLRQLAKDHKQPVWTLKTTPSDLLIQQAEERFQNGKKFFQSGDFERARVEFDAAIEIMLRASDSPSDHRLYEMRLEDMVDSIHRDDLNGMGAAAVAPENAFEKSPLDDIIQMTFPVDPRIKDQVRNEVLTTASGLPLTVNDTVLGYINYFSGRGRKTIENGLARAGKYRAMISRILAEEGVPQELIDVAQAESGFQPRALSYRSAGGLWQFVKFRGNQYGLMQTPSSDERLDPEKATRAAARHLHDLYDEFKDWYLAIAAYNCGPGVIEKAVERTGYADFFELRALRVLPNETANYVPIILAMTIMAKNAAAYGLDQVVADDPVEYDTVKTETPASLALIGDLTDTALPDLLRLNPALLRNTAPANFDIRVPRGTAADVMAGLEMIPAERRASWRMHKVEPGENVTSIARLFNAAASQIVSANNLVDGGDIAPGTRLVIPAVAHETAPATRAGAQRIASGSASHSAKPQVHTAPVHSASGATGTVHRTQPVNSKAPVHKPPVTIAQAKPAPASLNP